MLEIGPVWLYGELPQPIAFAWQQATQHSSLEALTVAGVVEIALRTVSGLQAAAILASERELPALVRSEHFHKPTLGTWVNLVLALRDAAAELRVPDPFAALAAWPDDKAEKLLGRIVGIRNELVHGGVMSRAASTELTSKLARDASALLETLSWLRDLDLCVFTEKVNLAGQGWMGRVQVFRGPEEHPPTQRTAWQGELELMRLYLRAPSEAGQVGLLDVEPFLARTLLGKNRHESFGVWKRVDKSGQVSISDDQQPSMQCLPIEGRKRLSKIKIFSVSSSATDLTRHEPVERVAFAARGGKTDVAGESESVASAGASRRPESPRVPERRWGGGLVWLLGGVLVSGLVLTTALLVGRSPAARSDEPLAERAGGVLVLGENHVRCELPDLGHQWRFDTIVLGNAPGMEYGLNVRGHYSVNLTQVGCGFVAEVTKSGYTQSGKRNEVYQHQRSEVEVSKSRLSVAASFALETTPGDPDPARVAFRWMRFGPHLVGLWRHEGPDWERGGYWGAVFGLREGWKGTPPKTSGFESCVSRCFAGRDPTDEATEACLADCARELYVAAD